MIVEWKKWIKNPKNLLLLGIVVLSVFVSLANLYYDNQKEDDIVFKQLKALNDEIDPPQGYDGPKEKYKLLMLRNEDGEFYSENAEEMEKLLVEIVYLLDDENTAQQQKKWLEKTEIQTKRLKLQQEYLNKGGEAWHNESQIQVKLARNQWLLEKQIPIKNMEIGQQGFYFVYYLLSQWMNYFIVIMIGLFFFDILTSEYERKTYLFVAAQPMSKKVFLMRKYVMANLIFSGGLLIVLLLGFSVASLFHGTGSLLYPMIIGSGDAVNVIPLWEYLLKTLTLQLLFISFSIGVLLLLSEWLKNGLEVLGLFLMLLLLPNVLIKWASGLKLLSNWLPFFYMNSNEAVTRNIGAFSPAFLSQAIILLGWNLILVVVWHRSFRRQRL